MASLTKDTSALEILSEIIVKKITNKICSFRTVSTEETIVFTVFPFMFYDTKYDVSSEKGRFYKCADDNGNWKMFDTVKSGIAWLDGDINALVSGDIDFAKENDEETENFKQTYHTKVMALGKFEIDLIKCKSSHEIHLYFKENDKIRKEMTRAFGINIAISKLSEDMDDFAKQVIDYMHNSTGEVVIERTYTYEWNLKTDNNRGMIDTVYVNKDLII